MDAARQPVPIVHGDLRARRAVDQHAVGNVVGLAVRRELLQIGPLALLRQQLRPLREIDGALRQDHARRSGDAAHAQIKIQGPQPLELARDLREQHAPDRARADQADGQRIRRQIERGVHGAQRLGRDLALDHQGNVALRGPLGDRPYVDGGIAERVEYLGGDAVRAGHAVADHGQDPRARAPHRRAVSGRRAGPRRTPGAPPPPPAAPARREWRSRSSARSCLGRSGSPRCPPSRSAPNSRGAVPGTPIIPAPSGFTRATGSMVEIPLTLSADTGIGADQRSALFRPRRCS